MKLQKNILLGIFITLNFTTSIVFAQENPAERWKNDIQRFMKWDSKNSYPQDAVLFVGSSSIRFWKTQESFPGYKVINRGFGGSQVSDVLYYYDKLVLKYKPKVIVLYSGDNDITAGKAVEKVSNDYSRFIELTHEKLPDTPIIIIPIKPSLSRWKLWPEMEKTNTILSEIARKNKMVYYVDTVTVLITDKNLPDNSLFLDDKLHLNNAGYKLWTDILKKQLHILIK